jgi:hypothetical protein
MLGARVDRSTAGFTASPAHNSPVPRKPLPRRAHVGILLVALAVAGIVALRLLAPSSPLWWILGGVLLVALLLSPKGLDWVWAREKAGVAKRNARGWGPSWGAAGAALHPARVEFQKDGSFEFHPANEPMPSLASPARVAPWLYYLTTTPPPEPHGSHVARMLTLDVRGGEPEGKLRRAIAKATSRATRALPGRGRVHALVHEEAGTGTHARLMVHLAIEGVGAAPAWADAAEEAFKREIARRLEA